MPSEPRPPRSPRVAAARYGIAEWYGKDITMLTPEERQGFGQLAVKQSQTAVRVLADAPPCPFLSTLLPGARCNKKGGVCSIRKYAPGEGAAGVVVPGDKIVTVCPN